MKCSALKLFIFVLVLVLCNANAKRFSSGGSSSRGSSSRGSSSRGGWFSSKPSYTPPSRSHAPTSFHSTGKSSSSDFLHAESGRPSLPAHSSSPVRTSQPVHTSRPGSPPYPTGSHSPSAPSHSSGFHTPSAPYPTNTHPGKSGVVHDQHQQSSAPTSHSNPYARQPAQNPHVANAPYTPSGGYGQSSNIPAAPSGISVPTISNGHGVQKNPPYPTSLPNHPHPNPSIGSSSFPSNSHPPPYSPSSPIHPQTYPNSHSSYNPSHGVPPPPYGSPNYGGSYHPGNSYNPGGSYHPPPPAYQPASAPFVPGRTVYVIPDSRKSSGPGIGSIIAGGVAGGVAAGATNAIVDHAISSIFRPSSNHVHTYPSAPPVGTPTSSVTYTTNNYIYGSGPDGNANANANQGNTGTPVNQPSGQPTTGQQMSSNQPLQSNGGAPGGTNAVVNGINNPPTATNGVVSKAQGQIENASVNPTVVSDDTLMNFTEELFDKQITNLNPYLELNLQKRVQGNAQGPVMDEAPEPLFHVKPEMYSIPTVSTLKALYDHYERNSSKKEEMTPERRNKENAFLDEIVKTPVMTRTLNWLVENKYAESDNYEQKDLLRRMWFTIFEETSSGFERIFLSEKFGDSGIVGMQNWIYFAHLESQKKVNYLGFVEMQSLSGKGSLLKLNYETEGFTMQNATIFAGTPPELELALYTVCFYARPNNWCPISLGGAKFFILTHSFRYFGKDLIDLGFPAF